MIELLTAAEDLAWTRALPEPARRPASPVVLLAVTRQAPLESTVDRALATARWLGAELHTVVVLPPCPDAAEQAADRCACSVLVLPDR